ncbi:hypothetical protein [Paracraurococcus lichenis]|uniref:DUF1127 domain-containing protein n=1 Tax=Paracraurococcus lichenis TaxID=3064888 RepID=A0ABT9E1M2_9PROT|nr:hypothetical protein [Paracraurococcus sp. LOR1-02]MDO9710041.1 hypothetical protein [Paracraurococcus sp. LOR1-02]
MPLPLNEIRARVDARLFWRGFLHAFGIRAWRVDAFERPVRDLRNRSGRDRLDILRKAVAPARRAVRR